MINQAVPVKVQYVFLLAQYYFSVSAPIVLVDMVMVPNQEYPEMNVKKTNYL